MQKNQVAYIGLNNLFGRIVTSLLKQSPNISKLVLYDDKNGGTVQSYTNGPEEECNVTTIYGRDRLPSALTKADIVVIGDELFQTPSPESITSIGHKAAEYARLIAAFSPNAILVIAAYPLNYVLPIFARVLEAAGCFDPRRLLGATSCDTLRASTLLSSRLRLSPQKTILPVIGGASSRTRIPLFSQANSPVEIDQDTKRDVVDKLKLFDGTEYSEADVIERAYASVRFTHSVLAARRGFTPIPEIALTRNEEIPNVEYFSMPLLIGKDGVEKIMKLPKLSPFESDMLQSAIECLNADISASKNLLNEKKDSDDVQDLGVQFRLIEDNEEQISKKYDIQNQELQDKSKDFMELDSVLTGVSDTVRNDVYEDTVKNEENVKINLPSMEEIHKVTTTFVMPHERHSTKLHAKAPAVSSPNMDEKAEDVDLMFNNILSKNNGLPFNKVTLSQVKKDIGFTKTEVYPDKLTRRRRSLSKIVSKENKSVKSFVFKPTQPTKRVYNYLKKSKKIKEANFLPEKSIIEKHVQTEGPFLKDIPRKLPLPVKLKIDKTGAKLAEPQTERKIEKPMVSFSVPIHEELNDELENTVYPLDEPKLITVENPDAYVDSATQEKSLVPFENINDSINTFNKSIESKFEKLQKEYDQFDAKSPQVVQNANKQMLKNQGIIDGNMAMIQDPEDRINALEVRDMAKRFSKLEQAIQKVLSMTRKSDLEAKKIKQKNTEKETSNTIENQEQTTQNVNFSSHERTVLAIPPIEQNIMVEQESPLNNETQMESQFTKTPELTSENVQTEQKAIDQLDIGQQKTPEMEVEQKLSFAPTQPEIAETTEVINQSTKKESSEIPEEEVNKQVLPKLPEMEVHKTEQVVVNESAKKQEPPTELEDKNLNLATNGVELKIDQLNIQQPAMADANFSQFETALDQIIETAPKSLPEATAKLEETTSQSVLDIKKKTIIKLTEPIKQDKPKIQKFDFFKELNERFELEKKLSETKIKNTKTKIPEYVQNVSEQKKIDVKSPNLINKLNENIEKNEEENIPDSFLLFKKAFDHVLSTASRSSVNLADNSKEEVQNATTSSPAIKITLEHKNLTTNENIEKEISALVNQLKKNKDVSEVDKILRKIYSELSEGIKTKKSSTTVNIEDAKSVKTCEKSIESLKKSIALSLPRQELKRKSEKKVKLGIKSIKAANRQTNIKVSTDNKEKDNLGLKDLIINIKKNNQAAANKKEQVKKESEKSKDGKVKIILAQKSKLQNKSSQENESKEVNLNKIKLESTDNKERTSIEDNQNKINLVSNTQPTVTTALKEETKLAINKTNLASNAQPKVTTLKEETKLAINETNLASNAQPNVTTALKEETKIAINKTNVASNAQPKVTVLKEETKPAVNKINLESNAQPKVTTLKETSDAQLKETITLKEDMSINEINLASDAQIRELIALKEETKPAINEINLKEDKKSAVNEISLKEDTKPVNEVNLSSDAQSKETTALKEDTKQIKIDLTSNAESMDVSKGELCINPLGPWCKETTALELNIPLSDFKAVKTDIKNSNESKGISIKSIETPSVKTSENKPESLNTKISKHRIRRRPKVVAMLRGLDRNDDEKFKIVKLEVKRNRLKSKTVFKPKMLEEETLDNNIIDGINIQTPRTNLITKASKKLAQARSKNRRNVSENEHTHKKIVRSLKAKQSLANEDFKIDESTLKLDGDNPVNKFLAKALEKKKLREAARATLKISTRRKRKDLEVKDSIKPYGFSLPIEKTNQNSGLPKSEQIIAEKKNAMYKKKVVNIQKISNKHEKKENIKISQTEKHENSIMKNTETFALKKKSEDKKIDGEKIKNDILNLKISINDPFPKNEKTETDICPVGSETPFPDWSPIADDFIPITGEAGSSNGIESMKAELDRKLSEEMSEVKKPVIDLVITPKAQEEPKKIVIPLNSTPENKLSAMKLELESTKAAVKAHNLNIKPQREKKMSTKSNTFISWETKNNTLKATSNKVKENLVSKQKLNEKSKFIMKSISNEAKVVKSATMLALREAHIKIRNSRTPRSSKSLANIAASLKQAVNYVETNTMPANKTKSASNLRSDTKTYIKQSKSNLDISGAKNALKPEISITKKGVSNKKNDDKITITRSEKSLKNRKYEYNIGKIKGGIKKLVVDEAFKSKNIHTQTDFQAKHDDKVKKENTIKGIIDLRNKQNSESPSDKSSVVDIAEKSLNESLKNAILLNAKEVTKDVFANRKIDIPNIEEKSNTKKDEKENIFKNLPSTSAINTTEKKSKSETSDSASFLNNYEGKQVLKLPIIKPPEPVKLPSELNMIPERKLKVKDFETHVQNLKKKMTNDTEKKQTHDAEKKPTNDTEKKPSPRGKSKTKETKPLKVSVESTKKSNTQETNTPERHPFIKKIEPKRNIPEKKTPERHPFIKKIEPKINVPETNTPERNPFIKKIDPNNAKKKPPKSPEYKAIDRKPSKTQELLNTIIEIKPSSICVHGPLPKKHLKPANSMVLPPRSPTQMAPPSQMKLSPEKKEHKRKNSEYFKDFNEPHIQQIKPDKKHPKLTEMKFMHENIHKNNSIYQNLNHSSHEKLNTAHSPTSLKSVPHPILPKKPVQQQPTKKIVAIQLQERPKPIIRDMKDKKNPLKLNKTEKIIDKPPNVVPSALKEPPSIASKKDGWGKLFNVFKQIISKDLEEENVERMKSVTHTTRPTNFEPTK